ncbi:MAG: tRNA pseudouridine(55) synthase TruB [Treponema sp.]|nr:tRNA pseudouridine(55) synthase TruB [Treponema sp.]
MNNSKSVPSGIVLFAKRPGLTSFSSLYTIKHALGTSKVGHTGTLDSFASGLLVVCVGAYTKLASRITDFDKKYEALIQFGSETDTLDPEGTVVKTAELPSVSAFTEALHVFTGTFDQTPPSFSAIHVEGKRASDMMREGLSVTIPPRKIEVYESTVLSLQTTSDNRVRQALVRFHVSKGTYIRSLARDIALHCHSAGYLAGLKRISVGRFCLEDAAGFDFLESSIDKDIYEQQMNLQIQRKLQSMNEDLAADCGFKILHLQPNHYDDFYNGRPLRMAFFEERIPVDDTGVQYAVLSHDDKFTGIIMREFGKLKYVFVVHH